MSDFYRVDLDDGEKGCSACGHGQYWTVVHGAEGDECQIGTSYADRETAEDVCDLMNMAYEAGRESAQSQTGALLASLKELVNLAEIGDADQDKDGWHPALNDARELIGLSAAAGSVS